MSTLAVNTIQAETGTTVSLSSGHNLIAPGHVIGMSHDTWSNTVGTQSYTSTSYADMAGTDISYTPKRSDSVIVVYWNIQARALGPSGQDVRYYVRTVLGGTASREYDIIGDNLGKLGDSVWLPQWINITQQFSSTGSAMAFKVQTKAGGSGNYLQLPHHGNNLNHISKTVWEIAQ
jgi:hypothetical protein